MLSPPFLELAYFVGVPGAQGALSSLTGVASIRPEVPISVPGIVGISTGEEATIDRGVVVLRTSGDAFSGPSGARKAVADVQGLKVQERFTELAERIENCAYGAILVEYSLEEPPELVRDPRSLAFRNFYVSRAEFGNGAIRQIIELAGADSYVKLLGHGVYVSMSRHFNPERRSIDVDEAMDRSARISALVGRTTRAR